MINKYKHYLIILLVGIIAWYPTLGFWFFKGYEATWLTGIAPYNIVNLIKGHAFLYFLDWKLFGWNPWGWYATSLTLHLIASILLFSLIYLISKNKLLSFVSALFFVASTSYNDVLTWGSFNSYYPLLLILMLSSAVTFIKYKDTQKLYFLGLSIAFAILGFFTRETGIIIVPILAAFDIVFSKDLRTKKTILGILKRQVPFYLVFIGFFVARSLYGGTGGDTADSNVKLQMRFVSDGLYLDYAKASLLTFGKLIPPQIVPYPLLNFTREFLSRFIYFELMNTYFFSILGWMFFGVFGAIWFKLRRSKEYSRLFLLFLIWLGGFSLFVSLAIPNTPEVLARAYEYNTMRYRYFAFVGTSVLLAATLIYFLQNKKIAFYLIVAGVVVGNILLIWRIEQKVYATSYKPAKEFYIKFTSFFPTLPKEAVFYLYPHASGLSDYLLEWYLIKEQSYPSLIGQPFRVESQIMAVLDKVKKEKINLSDTFFLDFDPDKGLINKTDEVRKLLAEQKEHVVRLNSKFEGPPVELPYNIELNLSLDKKDSFVGTQPDSSRFRALVDYSVSRNLYLNTVSLSTAYTMSQREGEPFFHVLPKNLIDGNTGLRSSWIADTFTPWVQVDLGEETEVAAVLWGSKKESTRIPATYSILVSKDGQKWETVKEVKNFNGTKNIDVFDKSTIARFVRMEVKTTSGGDFVLLDEFEVMSLEGSRVLSYYKDRDELFEDTFNMFKFVETSADLDYLRGKDLNTHWAKLIWETNTTTSAQNHQIVYFPYRVDMNSQRIIVELPEMEVYAGTGQFFKKRITMTSIDFGTIPFIIDVISLKLLPRISLR